MVHSLDIVLYAEHAAEICPGLGVLSFFWLPWESNTMEAAHHPRCGFPQQKRVHLLAFAYQNQRDMVEIVAEIGNEPFHCMWSGGEMVRVGQDHEFHLACAELLGEAFFCQELVLP